jgi:bifunctional DNA-binding transcriptional regulator/antitoxin component of YhaV-PrlF toxin-antitoxin module
VAQNPYIVAQYKLYMALNMEVVEVADKYRITIKRSIREIVPLKVGQKVAVVPFGEKILVQPLPENPEERLSKLTKGIIFNRNARKKASKYLISQAKQ